MQWNQLGVLGIGIDYQYDLDSAADPVVGAVEAAAQHSPLHPEPRKSIQHQRGHSLPAHSTAPTPEHWDQRT